MAPARAKISGGPDKTVKNAASAARPVTRYRMDEPTVETTSRHPVSRPLSTQGGHPNTERPVASAGRGGSGSGMAPTVATCAARSGDDEPGRDRRGRLPGEV